MYTTDSCAVHFVQSHGQGESHWRGRASLFSDKRTLYEDYHTHKPGSFSWPFEVLLPEHPDPKAIDECKHHWDPKEHFLSTGDFLEQHLMPPTFKFGKRGFGFRYDTFVEYVLKATIEQPAESKGWIPSFAKTAIVLIRVAHTAAQRDQALNLPCAINFTVPQQLDEKMQATKMEEDINDMRTQVIRHTMRSSKLSQEKSSSSSILTSFKDKAKSVVNPESLPKYSFDLVVKSSLSTQLLVNDLQFMIDVRDVADPEHTSITPTSYPDIRLENFSLSIEAATYLRFKSWVSDRAIKTKYDIVLCEKVPVRHTFDREDRARFDRPNQHDKDESTTEINLFDVIKPHEISTALISAKLGKQTESPLSPTFNTYIIAREYRLNWRIGLDIAGEKVRISNEQKLDLNVSAPEAFALDEALKGANVVALEVNEDNSDEESHEQDSKSVLSRFSSRRSKQQEAAEEAESQNVNNASTTTDEALPAYQPSSSSVVQNTEAPPEYAISR